MLLQQSYGEGPHYGEPRDLPSHNSISSSPFLGAGLVGKCLSAAWGACGQSRGHLLQNGRWWWERWHPVWLLPTSDLLLELFSTLWLKELLARGSQQRPMRVAATVFYARDYFSQGRLMPSTLARAGLS